MPVTFAGFLVSPITLYAGVAGSSPVAPSVSAHEGVRGWVMSVLCRNFAGRPIASRRSIFFVGHSNQTKVGRLPAVLRTPLAFFALLVAVGSGLGAGEAFASSPPAPVSFTWLKPLPAPSGWLLLVPESGSSLLWYPPWMRSVAGDPYSVSAALKDRNGTVLVYLNAGPKTGNEQMSNWPSFRIDHLREEPNRSVHMDAHASGLNFRGGKGSCVLDDYVTRVKAHHYREIACLVQGRTAESVIVAAALVSAWPEYAPQLEHAVQSWQVR